MMKKLISKIDENERDELKRLYERKSGITELLQIIDVEDKKFHNRILMDLNETNTKIDNWWLIMSDKYQFEHNENGQWEFNFEDCSIYLNLEL